MTRDEYIARLKTQLDRWNEDVSRFEAKAKATGKGLAERYERELDVLKSQRELARYNLRLLEDASGAAWKDLQEGADDAWERMRAAVGSASAWFDKKR